MSFDGVRSTEEPKVPDGMTALRIVAGYTTGGSPVAAICDHYWNIQGLREKCSHYSCEDCDDCREEIGNSDLIPVSHVQRIMWLVPSEAPTAKVAKAMDLSALIAAEPEPVSIEMVASDADESKIKTVPVASQSDKAKRDEALWGLNSR